MDMNLLAVVTPSYIYQNVYNILHKYTFKYYITGDVIERVCSTENMKPWLGLG